MGSLPTNIPIDSSSQNEIELLHLIASGYVAQSSSTFTLIMNRIAQTSQMLNPPLESIQDLVANLSIDPLDHSANRSVIDHIQQLVAQEDAQGLLDFCSRQFSTAAPS